LLPLTLVIVTMIYVLDNLKHASFSLLVYQGFVMNVQPSEAQAGFDIRVPPTANPESLERRIAEEWAPASRNMTFEVMTKLFFFFFTVLA
jgi:acetylornithine deacetylase/succinyl-diaminopimelate desuccinylase-like protein